MAGSIQLGLSLRGLLRFAVLLVAACLIGALVGLVTEPLGEGAAAARSDSASAKVAEGAPANAPDSPATPPAETPSAKTAASDPAAGTVGRPNATGSRSLADDTERAFSPDVRGLYAAGAALLVFVGIALALARKGRSGRPGNGAVHLVDTLHLGAGRRVHLLRVDGRRFLVGNSERGLNFLASVPQSDTERAFDAALGVDDAELEAAEGEPTFDRSLASALHGAGAR